MLLVGLRIAVLFPSKSPARLGRIEHVEKHACKRATAGNVFNWGCLSPVSAKEELLQYRGENLASQAVGLAFQGA